MISDATPRRAAAGSTNTLRTVGRGPSLEVVAEPACVTRVPARPASAAENRPGAVLGNEEMTLTDDRVVHRAVPYEEACELVVRIELAAQDPHRPLLHDPDCRDVGR